MKPTMSTALYHKAAPARWPMALLNLVEASASNQQLPAILICAVIAAIYTIAMSLSVAVLVFSGKLVAYISVGVGLALFSSIIIMLAVGLNSRYRGMVASIQEVPAVILMLMSSAIVAGFPVTASAEEIVPTVIAAIALGSLATGALCWLLGHLRLGGLVRFIPYPVIGGFLAATGWVLVAAGIDVCFSISDSAHGSINALLLSGLLSGSTLESLVTLIHPLAAVGVGVLLFVASRRAQHYLLIPGLLIGVVLVFFLVLQISGLSLTEAADLGLVPTPPENDGFQLMAPSHWLQVHWSLLFEQLPVFLVLIVLGVLNLLLNISGIELSTRQTVDLDCELRHSGIAQMAGGLGGGFPGFHLLGMSTLSHTLGARSRLVSVFAALLVLLPLVFGTDLVIVLPKVLMGGLLIYLGLDFLYDWLWAKKRELPLSDYLLILLILLVSAIFGLLEGIGVGLIVALIVFVGRYLRVSVIKNEFSATVYHSRLSRIPSEQQWLRQHGNAIGILQLQGFIFFGTGQHLLDHWLNRLQTTGLAPLRYSIFDCRLVTGLDSSALLSLKRMAQLAEQHQIELIFSGLSVDIDQKLRAELDALGRSFSDLDQAVEWCESRLLQNAAVPVDTGTGWLADSIGDEKKVLCLLDYFVQRRFEPGQMLIRQGAEDSEMLLIASGQVTIMLETSEGTSVRIRTMRMGSVVGEMGLYGNQPRAASVVADSQVVVYSLDRAGLQRLTQEQPQLTSALHQAMVKLMANRLADTTTLVQAMAL